MNTTTRRTILGVTAVIGLYVGVWAVAFPQSFYDSFPGLGLMWISVDGPYNEHLIRDVGALYVALAAASIVAAASHRVEGGRAVGVAWLVFSIPHLTYHVAHLDGFAVGESILLIVSLSLTVVLAVPLIAPARRHERTSS